MDYNVKALLEKYWAGESSLEEEQWLKAYFNQPDLPVDLAPFHPLFQYLEGARHITMPTPIKSIAAGKNNTEKACPKRRILPTVFWRSAAAVFLIICSVLVYQNINPTTNTQIVVEDTFETPQEAYQKTKEMLMLVSRKMNSGTDRVVSSMQKAAPATTILKE